MICYTATLKFSPRCTPRLIAPIKDLAARLGPIKSITASMTKAQKTLHLNDGRRERIQRRKKHRLAKKLREERAAHRDAENRLHLKLEEAQMQLELLEGELRF